MPPKKAATSKKVTKATSKKKEAVPPSNLPAVPEYTPLVPRYEQHEAVGLPQEYCTSEVGVFKQLFVPDIWEAICANTNAYYRHREPQPEAEVSIKPRLWRDITIGELKVWIGLLFYMGIVRCPSTADYWSDECRQAPMSAMSLTRFHQIKRFLHIAPLEKPDSGEKAREWWEKLEPMSSIAQQRCRECYLPSSNVAIDEMMVKCEGRSAHVLTMKNKPIDQGYKLFALADHGYTYTWAYHSRSSGTALASAYKSAVIPTERRLCPTSRTCLHLALSLPYQTHQFNIYFDNYFTNIGLYATLRDYGIGACGTARASVIPAELKVDKSLACQELQWNDLFGAVQDNVLCGLWQDSAQVLVMSTIHDLQTGTTRLRRRPKENQLNAKITRAVFGDEVRCT